MNDVDQLKSVLADALQRAQREDAYTAYVAEMEQLIAELQSNAYYNTESDGIRIDQLAETHVRIKALWARLRGWTKREPGA